MTHLVSRAQLPAHRWFTDRGMPTTSLSRPWYDIAWRRSGGNCFSRCVLWNWMTWGVREGEGRWSCSVGEGEFFRFNLLCSFRFHRDFISFHKAVHSLAITVVIFFNSHSSNSLLFDEEIFFSQSASRDLCCLSGAACFMTASNNGEYTRIAVNILYLLTPVHCPTPVTTWTLACPQTLTDPGSPVSHLLRFGTIHRLLIRLCFVKLFGQQPLCKTGMPYVWAALPTCCMSSAFSRSWLHYPNDETVVDFEPQTGLVSAPVIWGDNGIVWGFTARWQNGMEK